MLGREAVLRAGPPECCLTFGLLHLHGRVAQLAEHSTLNRQVGGSIPPASTIWNSFRQGRCRLKGTGSVIKEKKRAFALSDFPERRRGFLLACAAGVFPRTPMTTQKVRFLASPYRTLANVTVFVVNAPLWMTAKLMSRLVCLEPFRKCFVSQGPTSERGKITPAREGWFGWQTAQPGGRSKITRSLGPGVLFISFPQHRMFFRSLLSEPKDSLDDGFSPGDTFWLSSASSLRQLKLRGGHCLLQHSIAAEERFSHQANFYRSRFSPGSNPGI